MDSYLDSHELKKGSFFILIDFVLFFMGNPIIFSIFSNIPLIFDRELL